MSTRSILTAAGVVAALVAGWAGLQVEPAPFPAPQGEDWLDVGFDQTTGSIRWTQTLRYRGEGDVAKTPWRTDSRDDGTGTVTWLDQGSPWLVLKLEDAVFNSDVSSYVRARGP